MTTHRKEKLASVYKKLAGDFLNQESNRQSMPTITDALVSNDGRSVHILLTVLPEKKTQAVLDFLNRNKKEFGFYVKKNSRIGRLPRFDFLVDKGEYNRQALDLIE
jgi:ribosome-binding factor A